MRYIFNNSVEVKETDGLSKAMIKGIAKGTIQVTLIFGGLAGIVTIVSKYFG